VPNSPFHRRYIAFVDIVGFENIVNRMKTDHQLFNSVRDALKVLDAQAEEFRNYRKTLQNERKETELKGQVSMNPDSDLQMTAFSDCYVLSESDQPWHILAAVQLLGSRFLTKGILTRGSVVRGRAYHENRVLFGPGIVEAYKRERTVAWYPRILVSDEVADEEWGYHAGPRWKERLLQRDNDGSWYVNLLVPSLSKWTALLNPAPKSDVKSHLTQVRKRLIDAWDQAKANEEYKVKVWWLIHKFNRVAKEEGVETIPHKIASSDETE
jgi:hypothetical protein